MRNDRKKRDTERARERFKPSRGRRREMKIEEGGRGGQKKCKPKLHIKGTKPVSPLLLLLFSWSFLSAGHAWNEEREEVQADEKGKERAGETFRVLPSSFLSPLPLTLLMLTDFRRVWKGGKVRAWTEKCRLLEQTKAYLATGFVEKT